MASRMPKTSASYASPNLADIGTPEPILQWWPVQMALKLVRKFVSYEIRKFVHQVMYPVRVVLFLSGWPLVYFLRIMRYVFYGLYQACEFGYRHLSKSTPASPTMSPVPSPKSSISRPAPYSTPTRTSYK